MMSKPFDPFSTNCKESRRCIAQAISACLRVRERGLRRGSFRDWDLADRALTILESESWPAKVLIRSEAAEHDAGERIAFASDRRGTSTPRNAECGETPSPSRLRRFVSPRFSDDASVI